MQVEENRKELESLKITHAQKTCEYAGGELLEIEEVRNELAPLMQFRQREIIDEDIITIDISDDIEINEELQLNLFTTFGEGFKHDLEEFLRKIATENIVLQKIKKGKNGKYQVTYLKCTVKRTAEAFASAVFFTVHRPF